MHRASAYQGTSDFLAIARTALVPGTVYDDPFSEFNKLLYEYKSGKRIIQGMHYMIKKSP